MDKLRVALVTAFALLSFMLVIEFAKFKDEKDKALVSQQYSTLVNNEKTDSTSGKPIDSGDVPSIKDNSISSEIVESNSDANSKITVTTDNLYVEIDPNGGDIVHVALRRHLARNDTPEIPFVLLEKSERRTYIAQSGLVGKNGTDTAEGRPTFSSSLKNYTLNNNDKTINVDLNLVQNGVEITKRFSFNRGDYLIGVDYIIKNKTVEPWEAAFYGQIKRDDSNDPAAEHGSMGIAPYLGFATTTDEDRFKKITFSDIIDEKPFSHIREGGWIAMIQHYFLSVWIPDPKNKNEYTTIKSQTGFYLARVKSPVTIVNPNSEKTIYSSFYAGPKDQYKLEKISASLDLSVDYGMLWMIAQPLYALMYFFNKGEFHMFGYDLNIFGGIGNWGFSIILLTIFVKLCFFSLNAKAYSSMAKMRAIQPKMLEIKDRYAEDKQRQSKEMMALYGKEGVNPLGGCLPMLVQMPVFMALYWVLLESVELRHAPFIGYIHDLSAMDPYFIMPLIMGASMWFQQKLNPPPPDPMQAKVMQFLPIIFTFFFLFFPSGLVLYWIVNNILSISQQWIITKNLEKSAEHK